MILIAGTSVTNAFSNTNIYTTMAFKAVLKVGGEERTLLTYHNQYFDIGHDDFEKVTKLFPTLYDYMAVAKASNEAFKPKNTQPFGGLFDLTMESTDDDDFFYYWFKTSKEGNTSIENGVIELYDSSDEYMPMRRIEFWDAWVNEISEHQCSIGSQPMIMSFTISPATIRVNKELVFQKNWWQTDINRKRAQPQEKAEPAIKRIYWKGKNAEYTSYIERKDIMLNHNIELIVEFSKYKQGDNVELIVKQSNSRRIKGQAKEFTINGIIDENGEMRVSNFKVECDFKEDNQDFGNIEFYYNDNKVGDLKENFGWTYINDNGLTQIFLSVELFPYYIQSGYTESSIKEAINSCFQRVLEKSTNGMFAGKIFYCGTFTRELPQIVPKVQLIKGERQKDSLFNAGGTAMGILSLFTEEGKDIDYLMEISETAVHELLHTLRLDHPHELTQSEDTKLYHHGYNNYSTALSTDPNIYFNIMNYDTTIIEGHELSEMWKRKRPEYLTKGQIQLMLKEIDLHKQGVGTVTDVMHDETQSEMDWYWLAPENYPGTKVTSRYRK